MHNSDLASVCQLSILMIEYESEAEDQYMKQKVTIQDIADALGMSRNTVSKAINNSEGIAEATRDKILEKAVEMGYKQFSYVASMTSIGTSKKAKQEESGEISLFTTISLSNSHFASLFMDNIHEEITQMGYTLSVHRISRENIKNRSLPRTFSQERSKGIICIEVFDPRYCDMISELGIPVLFVDGPARKNERSVNGDQLLMDNYTEITHFVNLMIERGLTKIGFIGDYEHCQSFWERYCAYRLAMISAGIEINEHYVINTKDKDTDSLADLLENLKDIPDVYICANDFVAIDAIQLLILSHKNILKKTRFLGFDDSHESRIFHPALSTVHIHSQSMAFSALHLLMTRIKEPTMEYRTIYVATDLVLRESTEF